MLTACLLVAGALRATLPAPAFTLAWMHSIEKTRWEENYVTGDTGIALVSARIQNTGAGMEPGPGAVLADGWWTWQPLTPPLPALRLTRSPYTADYTLCSAGRCQSLSAWTALTGDVVAVVTVAPCNA